MYRPEAKEKLASTSPSRTHTRSSRSRSPRSESEQQEDQSISNVDREMMGVTSQGRPPRVSRRKRSEYLGRSWNRSADQERIGRTGAKARSTSRH
ncbi:hypothetical protein PHISP_03960 [Aspergillus sp. HF37]|nr:hypothetical protein PHISP_03960 [Aspergillus sp. HF37]